MGSDVRFRANRTLSRHRRMTESDPKPVISWIEISQRSSLLPYRGVLSFWSQALEALRVKRREFISLFGGAAAWPLAARAQQPAKLPTIGFLGASTPAAIGQWVAAFVQRLRELGWIENRTVAIEYRWAEGRSERYAEIAAEIVQLKVDVIVTHSAEPVLAANQATSVIPIVFGAAADPVGHGLVASLARPRRNGTS